MWWPRTWSMLDWSPPTQPKAESGPDPRPNHGCPTNTWLVGPIVQCYIEEVEAVGSHTPMFDNLINPTYKPYRSRERWQRREVRRHCTTLLAPTNVSMDCPTMTPADANGVAGISWTTNKSASARNTAAAFYPGVYEGVIYIFVGQAANEITETS